MGMKILKITFMKEKGYTNNQIDEITMLNLKCVKIKIKSKNYLIDSSANYVGEKIKSLFFNLLN